MARGVKKEKANAMLTPEEKLAAALVPVEEQPYRVPGNWCWTTLSNVAEVITGSTPSKKHPEYYGDMFPFFKPSDLDAGRYVYNASEYLSEEGKKVSRIIPAHSSAVCCIGSIGKSGFLMCEGTTNQQINSAVPRITPLYLYYYFQTDNFVNELWNKASATTISIVNKSKMEQCTFPLAPLFEQQRIVDRIESLFAKLDEAKEKAQAVVDGFEDRKAAVLHRAFSGELTRKWRETRGLSYSDWTYQSYGELGSSKLGKMLDREKNIGKPVRYLRNVNVRWFEFNLDDIQTMLVTTEEQESLSVKDGDMFICEGGEPGRCAIWHGDGNGMVFQKALHRFRPNEKVISDYLCFYLFYLSLSDALSRYFTGTTIKHLTGKALAEIRILLPQIEEQQEIVKLLGKLIKKELKAKEAAEQTLIQIDTMKKTILALAFRGELSTNDPTDESAEELLKEIL